eukprot:scaffold269263_cov18-Tisochrysis_lutea.AAC.1
MPGARSFDYELTHAENEETSMLSCSHVFIPHKAGNHIPGPMSGYLFTVQAQTKLLCFGMRLQGFQDLGAKDIAGVRELLYKGALRVEGRTQAAQKEGGVHDMVSYERRP